MSVWNCSGYLCKDTGITRDNVPWFNNVNSCVNWFYEHSSYIFTEYSYTRLDDKSKNAYASGCIHIDQKYDSVVDCDYVVFQNVDINPDRTFYGYITNREYVNPNSTRVWFEIDWYLSYFDVMQPKGCLVLRSHVKDSDDWNGMLPSGRYTQPEPITAQLNEYYSNSALAGAVRSYGHSFEPEKFHLYALTDANGNIVIPDSTHDFGARIATYNEVLDDLTSVANRLIDYKNHFFLNDSSTVQAILRIVMIPDLPQSDDPVVLNTEVARPNRLNNIRADGATVYHAKSIMFPYYYSTIKSTGTGELAIKYEDYVNDSGYMGICAKYIGGESPRYLVAPYNVDRNDYDHPVKFVLSPQYPTIAFSSDSFAEWLNANGAGSALIAAAGMISTIVGAVITASGTVPVGVGLMTAGAGALGSTSNNISRAAYTPDIAVGHTSGQEALAFGQFVMEVYDRKPSVGDLTAIDDYFDRYGYALNEVMIPDLHVRQRFTYIKTSGATIQGAAPIEAIMYFKNMLDSGCTFWDVQNGFIGALGNNPDS